MEARNRSLPDWFTYIRTGQVRLPRFQRDESWSTANIENLLDTMLRGLPAGAALILAVGDEERFISRPISGAPDLVHKPTEHLLDGQQRLTALWRSLHGDYEERAHYIIFEGDEDGIPVPRIFGQPRWHARTGTLRPLWVGDARKEHERGLIPLPLLRPGEIQAEIRDWCTSASPDDVSLSFDLERQILELRQTVNSYNIPFLELLATTPKDVALDVFIKMNTSFVRLTPFDVIVAQYEAQTGESLQDLVHDMTEQVPVLAAYVEPKDLVLEMAALREDRSPTQASYFRLDLVKLKSDWNDLVAGAKWAADFLEAEGILDAQRLPALPVVRVLGGLHSVLPGNLDALGSARTLLRKYLWRGFFTSRYEAAASTSSLQDFRALRDVLLGSGDESAVPIFDEQQYPLPDVERLKEAKWPSGRDSLGRAVLAVTLRAGARDIADDAKVTREQLVSREHHHLFPIALLRDQAGMSRRHFNRALNCALLSWATNRNIAARDPLSYLRERSAKADLGDQEIRQRLESHYIPFDALAVGDYMKLGDDARREKISADYERFLDARAEVMIGPILDLCQGKQP